MLKHFYNWNFMRFFRLLLGCIIVAQGVYSSSWEYAIVGGIFCFTTILNIGCCSTKNCSIYNQKQKTSLKTIIYEEVQ